MLPFDRPAGFVPLLFALLHAAVSPVAGCIKSAAGRFVSVIKVTNRRGRQSVTSNGVSVQYTACQNCEKAGAVPSTFPSVHSVVALCVGSQIAGRHSTRL